MKGRMTQEQVDDLLDNVIEVHRREGWKGDKQQFCCPIHGESHSSCGVNIDYVPDDHPDEHYQVFHCFSCGEGGTIPWLLFKALPDRFKTVRQAEEFISSRYKVTFHYVADETGLHIKRFDEYEAPTSRFEMPKHKLALFKSGKETYQYFFNRGFDKSDMKKFMIGRDLEEETVTIPVYWEDNVLAGVIGRYIDPNRPHNMRFRIYDFPKSGIVYPLNHLEVVNRTIIGVEGMMDSMMMNNHWGYPNTVSVMGDGMSKEQADIIAERCEVFMDLFDNDQGGRTASSIARKRLGKRVMFLSPTYYPDKGKDPTEWGEYETNKVIRSMKLINTHSIERL